MAKPISQQWHEMSEIARDAGIEPPPMPTNPHVAAGMLSSLRNRIRNRRMVKPVNILQAAEFGLDCEEQPYEPTGHDAPTPTKPGTAARVEVYAARVAGGKHLFDKEDQPDWS